MPKTIYISGPMSGLPECNYPAFNAAAAHLRALGYSVENPAENPDPDTDTDKPTEEQDKSLCEKHPEILACSKPELDVPDGEIPRTTKQISYAEEGGFGGGSCPSNVYANLQGKQPMVYEWTRTCSVVSTYIRPIILLLGAMGALFILIPGRDS